MLDVLNDRYVEVSFTETVKSTAPAFTLVLSSLLLGEIIQKLLILFKGFNSQNVNLMSR
jgi:drug/metabolite transporter (DMT)-like permease